MLIRLKVLTVPRRVGTYTMQDFFVKAGVGQSRTFCLCLQVRDDLEWTMVPGGRWNLAAQHSIQEVVKRWADQYNGTKIKFFFEEE